MALKTAIYMRVSTADQSVDSQRQELQKFIERRDDLELVGEYADVISGTREKREQLDRLMIDARQRKIDVVVFFDLSRLTRKGLSHADEDGQSCAPSAAGGAVLRCDRDKAEDQ